MSNFDFVLKRESYSFFFFGTRITQRRQTNNESTNKPNKTNQILSHSSHLEEAPNVSLLFTPRSANFWAHWMASKMKNASLPNSWKVYTPLEVNYFVGEEL